MLRFSSEWLPNFADSLFFRNFLEIETRCKIWGENYWSVIFQSLRKSWKARKKREKQSKRERLFPQINRKVSFLSHTRLVNFISGKMPQTISKMTIVEIDVHEQHSRNGLAVKTKQLGER